MSQAKVDKYKNEKANRKKTNARNKVKVDQYKKDKMNRKKNMQKDKMKRAFRRIAVGVVSLALVGWLGYSVYNVYDSNKPQQTAEIDYSAITNYQQSLVTTDGE